MNTLAFYLYLIQVRWFTPVIKTFLVQDDFDPHYWDKEEI